jgi:hypothetical protein
MRETGEDDFRSAGLRRCSDEAGHEERGEAGLGHGGGHGRRFRAMAATLGSATSVA